MLSHLRTMQNVVVNTADVHPFTVTNIKEIEMSRLSSFSETQRLFSDNSSLKAISVVQRSYDVVLRYFWFVISFLHDPRWVYGNSAFPMYLWETYILFLEMCVQNRGPFRSVFNTRHLIINHHQDSQFDIWVEDFPFIFVPYLLRVLSTLLIVEIYSSCSSDCWASDFEVEIGRSSIPHFPLKGTFFFLFFPLSWQMFHISPRKEKDQFSVGLVTERNQKVWGSNAHVLSFCQSFFFMLFSFFGFVLFYFWFCFSLFQVAVTI